MTFMQKKLTEIRAMSEAEIMAKVSTSRAELLKVKALIAGNTRPENPGRVRKLRREVAKMLTINNEAKQKKEAKKEVKKKIEVKK